MTEHHRRAEFDQFVQRTHRQAAGEHEQAEQRAAPQAAEPHQQLAKDDRGDETLDQVAEAIVRIAGEVEYPFD